MSITQITRIIQEKQKLDSAVKTLDMLGALKPDGSLTPDGEAMTELPLDPHVSRLVVEAKKHGNVEAAIVLAGFLNNRNSIFALGR